MEDHVIVCGLGNVGFHAVALLLALGERVAVVTAQTRESWLRQVQERGLPVIIGDARDQKLLVEVGLEKAKSLVAITDADLTNIEIVLDARRVRPDLPVVVRLFDQTLAPRLEGVLDIRRAVGVSGLSAPVFAAAALGERVIGSMAVAGVPYVIGRYQVEGDGTTLGEFAARHHVMPISVRARGVRYAEPAPETRLEANDRVILLAAKADWDRLTGDDAPPRRPLWRRLFELLRPTLWWSFMSNVWRNAPLSLRSTFVVFNLVLLLSVGVFHLGMHLSFRDAFYLVVSTVTTVGFGDVVPSKELRLFACVVMLLGSLATGILYSILTDFVVAARFSQLLGDTSRVPEAGHVIVVGTGSIGFRIVEALRSSGAQVVVIDRDAEGRFMEAVRGIAPVLIGDARQDAVLRRARIETALGPVAQTRKVAATAAASRPGGSNSVANVNDMTPDFLDPGRHDARVLRGATAAFLPISGRHVLAAGDVGQHPEIHRGNGRTLRSQLQIGDGLRDLSKAV
ncbi:MAG: NAD-binding protein [Candidatus Xenobia bacterium]